MILTTPSQIDAFRVLALRGALKLECVGLRKRGRSAYSIVKTEFGFKGSKESVLEQLTKYIQENIVS